MNRRHMKLVMNNSDRILTLVDIEGMTDVQVLQWRFDLAKEYELRPGEARFVIMESNIGPVLDVLDVPV